jgi:excisionase family DNA binding protein
MSKRAKPDCAARKPQEKDATAAEVPAEDRVELFVNGIQVEATPGVRRASERGKPLSLELTVAQAAAFLNTSHLFVLGLIERGELPCRTVGKRQRIPSAALVEYRTQRFQREKQAGMEEGLAEMTRLSQEMGLCSENYLTRPGTFRA